VPVQPCPHTVSLPLLDWGWLVDWRDLETGGAGGSSVSYRLRSSSPLSFSLAVATDGVDMFALDSILPRTTLCGDVVRR
jgi:hypothetical protein